MPSNPATTMLRRYTVLAYGLAWGIWIPLVVIVPANTSAQATLYVLGFTAPLGAALLVNIRKDHPDSKLQLLRRLLLYRFHVAWYGFILLGPALLFLLAAAINAELTGKWPDMHQYGRLPDLFPGQPRWRIFLLHWLIIGVGEEVGWRGVALPLLQRDRNALRATFYLSLIWGPWHLPVFLLQHPPGTALLLTLGFTLMIFPIAILYTWLYNSNRGSLLLVSLWSTSLTMAIASPAAIGFIPPLLGGLLALLAGGVVVVTGSKHLAWQHRIEA